MTTAYMFHQCSMSEHLTTSSATAEIVQVCGHYAIDGHSRSLTSVPGLVARMRFPINE